MPKYTVNVPENKTIVSSDLIDARFTFRDPAQFALIFVVKYADGEEKEIRVLGNPGDAKPNLRPRNFFRTQKNVPAGTPLPTSVRLSEPFDKACQSALEAYLNTTATQTAGVEDETP